MSGPSSRSGAGAAPSGARTFTSFREIADFLWQNAERMRGAYKPNEYDKVILPLLVVRRIDCVLEPTKEKVLARLEALKAKGMKVANSSAHMIPGAPSFSIAMGLGSAWQPSQRERWPSPSTLLHGCVVP